MGIFNQLPSVRVIGKSCLVFWGPPNVTTLITFSVIKAHRVFIVVVGQDTRHFHQSLERVLYYHLMGVVLLLIILGLTQVHYFESLSSPKNKIFILPNNETVCK